MATVATSAGVTAALALRGAVSPANILQDGRDNLHI